MDYELINRRMNEIHKMCDKRLNDIEDNIKSNDIISNLTKTNNNVLNKINDSDTDSDNDNNNKKKIYIKIIN